MAITELKEAVGLLARMPLLWIPGIVGGAFAAVIWLTLFISGAFFTSRLLVILSLVLLFFITGMLSIIRNNEATGRKLLEGGLNYYFRVLLPTIVIGFSLMIVFIICSILFAILGLGSDIELITVLTFGMMIPTLMLTFFFDTAAVFEDRKVFESIRRSILLVSEHMMDVLSFFIVSAFLCAGILFGLMIVWEAILFDKLKPIMDFTDAERAAFTPDQLFAMIGQDGMWVTAIILFIGVLIVLPILYSYKACFFKKMASNTVTIEQQTIGEYDSKGRWYKY
ncbi:MAG: hypothetical protein WC379_16240 [Methanoregula sp.]|jgi:hypothetical protein